MVFFRIFLKISPMNDDEVSRIFRILRRGLRNSFEFEKVLMTADMILSLYILDWSEGFVVEALKF